MAFLERNANRGSVSTGYNIENSLKLERANSEYLNRTPSSNGNQQIFTFSSWVKFSHINSGVSEWSTLFSAGNFATNSPSFRIGHHTNNSLQVSFYTNSQYTGYYRTDALHRDTAAWYHFVCAIDTTQGTNTNRVKMYVNGVLAPATSVVSHISQNYNTGVNTGIAHKVGAFNNTVDSFVSEYVAETHFVDGQALAPTDFGEFDEDSGIWIPKKYTGSYGTNGFYLDYADASDLGDDESGNGNDWTENNIAAVDQSTDTPTNNFAVLNFNHRNSGTSGFSNNPILTEGATVHTSTLADYWQTSIATIGVTSGKWYFEAKIQDSNTTLVAVGMGDEGDIQTWGVNNGYLGAGKSLSYGSGSSAYTHSNIIGIAVDVDNGKVYWAKDNTYINSGNPAGNANGTAIPTGGVSNGTYFLGVSGYKLSGHAVWQVNFGGYTAMSISSAASDANGYGTFEYAPPSGFYALCSKNLAEYG